MEILLIIALFFAIKLIAKLSIAVIKGLLYVIVFLVVLGIIII